MANENAPDGDKTASVETVSDLLERSGIWLTPSALAVNTRLTLGEVRSACDTLVARGEVEVGRLDAHQDIAADDGEPVVRWSA